MKIVYLDYRTWGISLRRSGWSGAAECGLASRSFGDGVLAGARRSGYTCGARSTWELDGFKGIELGYRYMLYSIADIIKIKKCF